jgi:hypothetical protein
MNGAEYHAEFDWNSLPLLAEYAETSVNAFEEDNHYLPYGDPVKIE